MKAAFAYWDNRIAPVFDTARQIHIVEAVSEQIMSEMQETLSEDLPVQKVLRLVDLGIGTLVCGAISRPMHGLVAAYGIHVVSFVAGDLCEVIRAWLIGNLECDAFTMPGCCGGEGLRFKGMHVGYKEVNTMNQKGSRMSVGGGQGLGRMGGPFAVGPAGYCICPQCGQREPHERGVPCVTRKCPKCGTMLTRQ